MLNTLTAISMMTAIQMTETTSGKNLFDMYFDFLVWPLSHPITWIGLRSETCICHQPPGRDRDIWVSPSRIFHVSHLSAIYIVNGLYSAKGWSSEAKPLSPYSSNVNHFNLVWNSSAMNMKQESLLSICYPCSLARIETPMIQRPN